MLHDPIDKCKCNLYVKDSDDKDVTGTVMDKETAAFYNVYRSAIIEVPPLYGDSAANAVKYNTISTPKMRFYKVSFSSIVSPPPNECFLNIYIHIKND